MNCERLLSILLGFFCCFWSSNESYAQINTTMNQSPIVMTISHSEVEAGDYVIIRIIPNNVIGEWSMYGPGIQENQKAELGKIFEKSFIVNSEGLLNYTIIFKDENGIISYVGQKTLKSESTIKYLLKSSFSTIFGAFLAIFSIYAKDLLEYKMKAHRMRSIFRVEVNFFLSKVKKSCETGNRQEILSCLCPKSVTEFDSSGISIYDTDGNMRVTSNAILSLWEKLKTGTITIQQFSTGIDGIKIIK